MMRSEAGREYPELLIGNYDLYERDRMSEQLSII